MHLEFLDDDRPRPCTVEQTGTAWTVTLAEGEPWTVLSCDDGAVDLLVDVRRGRAWVARRDGERLVFLDGHVHVFRLAGAADDDADEVIVAGGPLVTADMPGKVVKVLVSVGDEVAIGTPLLILEAMKMEAEIPAPLAGRIVAIMVEQGRTVGQGELLLEIEPPAGEPT